MVGRRSVWSDERLIEIASRFVPAADEVWRLQRGTGPECRFFQRFADRGHYRAPGGTRQGIYVVTPSGKLLASANSLSANQVLAMLRRALKDWDALPRADRGLATGSDPRPRHRWEQSDPKDGLVLVSTNRDLPADGDPASARGERWNRDHVWFTREEGRAWLPDDPKTGDTYRVPDFIAHRLARFHLVDNVRGQTIPFAAKEVADAHLETTVLKRDGVAVSVRIRGETNVAAEGPWLMGKTHWKPPRAHPRGVWTRLLGQATYDLDQRRFTRFELVAIGERWGRTENNARRDDEDHGPIGFVFTLAAPNGADRVPPAFIDAYNADWVIRPEK